MERSLSTAPRIDIDPPPDISISPVADMDPDQTIVTAALAAKSSAETPTKARSALVVLIVAAHPDARLVAPPGCAVEPLVQAPEAVQSARIGGIGVVDDAVLERSLYSKRLSCFRSFFLLDRNQHPTNTNSVHGNVIIDRDSVMHSIRFFLVP